MLVLVLGSSFLVTFLGWEGVGLCSYLLVSFWFQRNSAAVAGKKAFITTRVGDVGFMVAMFLIFAELGSLDYGAMSAGAGTLAAGTATAIALLLFLGAVGKSAQIPLHVWLPDAMEGPTPVSALIHAATMVTAGVFLVARAHPFFEASGGSALTVVSIVGAATALLAATVALIQVDIKRVLAYSTISQLGFMFLALGVRAYVAAIFLVVAHAFYKATLFLGAGSVIHGSADNQDMRTMGGLRKYMPFTALGFIVAWLAIAGVPPFAGFWAKDEVLSRRDFRRRLRRVDHRCRRGRDDGLLHDAAPCGSSSSATSASRPRSRRPKRRSTVSRSSLRPSPRTSRPNRLGSPTRRTSRRRR